MIIIKNKKLLISLSVFFIAFLFTGCSPFNIPQTINETKLTSIEILPSTMTIGIGKTKAITSVTAHYDNGTSAGITLSTYIYESDK